MKRRINLFEIQPSEKTAESDKKPVAVKKFQNTAEFELLNPVTMIQHSEPNQFGNKRDYYIKRGTRMSVIDPRLVALDRALFAEKDILDVGCHCGLISLQLGKYFEAKTVKGIDLDYRLINTASTFWIKEERRTHKTEDSRDGDQSGGNAGESSKSVSMNFEDESEEIDLPAPPSKSVAVSMNGVLPPIEPRKKTDKSGYPYNVKFEVCNILQLDTAAVEERYDVIMLLSVTKWIQLNFGDDGIRKLFRVVKSLLKVGGRVVLEPQRFKSYSKLASVCARFQAIYPGITIKPEDYESILVGELGLMKEGTFQSLARDSFKRDIMIYSDMKAIIMAGGYGTRLRPLTMHSPKSVIEFAHSTVFEIQIAALIAAGVQEIMICLAHQAECIEKIVDELRVKYKVKMTLLLQHPTMPPMNALKLAKDLLYIDNPDELFYVCNSDVMTEFPFVEMKQHMTDKSVDLVMCVSKSKTPSLFGVVSCDEQGRVLEFHEKPQVFKGDLVNAGIYLFRNHIADMVVEQDISSILTIFDILMAKKAIKSFQLAHYWMDIGNPRDYLEATKLHLNYLKLTKPEQLTPEVNNHIIGNDLFDPSAYIGPDVLIGPGAVVGPGVRLKSSVLFSNSKVDASAFVESTILSWRSVIGRHARIHGLTVIAEDVNISNEVFINQAQILPNTSVKENIEKAGQIKLV